jgi:hypothetical protein
MRGRDQRGQCRCVASRLPRRHAVAAFRAALDGDSGLAPMPLTCLNASIWAMARKCVLIVDDHPGSVPRPGRYLLPRVMK